MKEIIATNKAPSAIGPYSQGIKANGFVFTSGQIPLDPATGAFPEGIKAHQTILQDLQYRLPAFLKTPSSK